MAPFTAERFQVASSLRATLLLAPILAFACSQEDTRFDTRSYTLRDVVGIGQYAVFVEQQSAQAYVVHATDPNKTPVRVKLESNPVVLAKRKGEHEHALVLCVGSEGSLSEAQSTAGLVVVSEQGAVRRFTWDGNPFDVLDQDASGDYAVLSQVTSGARLLRNANEVAFIRLDAESNSDEALRFVTLPAMPQGVVFSSGFKIAEEDRRLAVVAMEDRIGIVDLEHPAAAPAYVVLNTEPSQRLWPQQIIFDGNTSRIYVRAANADDIFSIRLAEREPPEGKLDFDIAVDIIAAGDNPTDLRTFALDGIQFLAIVADTSRTLELVDVATSRSTSVRLPEKYDRIHVYENSDDEGRPHALLWRAEHSALADVPLLDDAQALEQGLQEYPDLRWGIKEMVEVDSGTFVFIGDNGLSVLRSASNELSHYVSGNTRLQDGILDRERGRLWIAPSSQSRVAYLDFSQGSSGELNLDANIRQALLLPESGRLLTTHRTIDGYFSSIDVLSPSRSTTLSIRGFLLAGILD